MPRSKHSVSVITASQLMLYREIIAVCSEIRTKNKYTVWAERGIFLILNLVVHIVVPTGVYRDYVFIWVSFVSSSLFLFLFFTVLVSSSFLSDCYHSNLTPNNVTRFPLVSSWLTAESDLNSCQAQNVSTHILHSVQDRLCIL